MVEIRDIEIMEVDIHRFYVLEAKNYLERLLVNIPFEIKEVKVIHGWRRGTALRDMVRNELQNSRIKRRFISLNPGVTSLILSTCFEEEKRRY